MAAHSDLRPSPIAGTWYSGDPQRLGQQVDAYLDQAVLPPLSGRVVGLVAPHAGHRYSGRTAGHAFAAVRGQAFDQVVVLSPLHDFHPAPLLTTAHRAYGTPLGPVPVDISAVEALDAALAAQNLRLTPVVNDREHSLEIELPFLQRALSSDFRLIPIMVRSRATSVCRALGLALAELLCDHSALLVASTDLSHFYPLHTADALDAEMLRRIAAFSPEDVLSAEETGAGFACGAGPVAVMLWAARALGANTVTILHHSTSAEETGDTHSVVGYGAAVALGQG